MKEFMLQDKRDFEIGTIVACNDEMFQVILNAKRSDLIKFVFLNIDGKTAKIPKDDILLPN